MEEYIMKKTYETPEAEKMEFNYRDQVVAASAGNQCIGVWNNEGHTSCTEGNPEWVEALN